MTIASTDVVSGVLGGLSAEDLAKLLSDFQSATSQLETAHVALQGHVSRLEGELRETRAQLRRARELAALGEMAAGIAPEVRNPLGSIRLFAEMLREDLVEQPASAAVAGKITRAVDGLDAIVGDVLTFSREVRPRGGVVDVEGLVHDAVSSCEGCCGDGAVEIVVGDVDDPGEVDGDQTLLMQALVNVVRNGCEAVVVGESGRGRVTVWSGRRRALDAEGRRVEMDALCVRDDGDGMDEEVRGRVFNPFFTTREAGTGLGLAIVHRILDAHGGRVVIESWTKADRARPGTVVELLLPRDAERADA